MYIIQTPIVESLPLKIRLNLLLVKFTVTPLHTRSPLSDFFLRTLLHG